MTTQDQIVFGIDLGTTYSCIAYVDESGRPVVVPNADNTLTMPSVVQFEEDNRIVGQEAKNNAVLHPDEVVELVKRQMGAANWRFPYGGHDHSAEEISSYILSKVVADAEQSLQMKIRDVVITVPAYFGSTERDATRKAGVLANLNVLSILDEPTAAALSYGLHERQVGKDQVILVYDLGGGTFDVTLIALVGGNFRSIATGGNHQLGGRDWDAAIVRYLADEWKRETDSRADPLASAETLQALWGEVERAKITLTTRPRTEVAVSHEGRRVGIKLTREKFDELTASKLEETIQHTRDILEQGAAEGYGTVDEILLVGGSTKMPQVKERLLKQFGREPTLFDPDLAVAKGAALYGYKKALDAAFTKRFEEESVRPSNRNLAAEEVRDRVIDLLSHERAIPAPAMTRLVNMKVTTVTSRSFGVIAINEEGDRRIERVFNLIKVNQPLPIDTSEPFYTLEPNQEAVQITIVENISLADQIEPAESNKIGEAVLTLPSGLPKRSPLEVKFELDEQGLLQVTARDMVDAGRVVHTEIKTARAISGKEFEEAKDHANKVTVA